MNATFERFGPLFSRLALAGIFLFAGWGKLTALDATAGYIGSIGLPAPGLLALLAGLTEVAGGLALALGWGTRWAALALALFLVPTTALFHNPLGLEAAAAHAQQLQLLKNLAILGGLVSLALQGAGPLALDAKSRRRAGADARLASGGARG